MQAYEPGTHPDLPPPRDLAARWTWLRRNLFTSLPGTLLMFLCVWLLFEVVSTAVDWAFLSAVWSGEDGKACRINSQGACWAFVRYNFKTLMVFDYPSDQIWRVVSVVVIGTAGLLWLSIDRAPRKAWIAVFLVLVFPVAALFTVYGGLGLPAFKAEQFGGLGYIMLFVLLSFPLTLALGLLLALGSQSPLPVVRLLCMGFIGLWRGVPVNLAAFIAAFAFFFIAPPIHALPPLATKLLVTILLFSAYAAEIIRDGFQAVSVDQHETAKAFGFTRWQHMGLITIPQALRLAKPGLINVLAGLIKASVIINIGVFLSVTSAATDAMTGIRWLGTGLTHYVFVALVFWCLLFGLSRYGRHLEKVLAASGVGKKQGLKPDTSLAATSLA